MNHAAPFPDRKHAEPANFDPLSPAQRAGRSGAAVSVQPKSVPFFKTGKEMHQRLNPPEA